MTNYELQTDEKYKVLIKKDVLVDAAREDRKIPLKIYYPSDYDGDELPVIFWSHGLGGSVDGAAFISRYLASQGYVLVHVQHPGTDSSLWEGKDGHPWDIIRNTPIPRSATLNRFHDVPFVLDSLEAWIAQHEEVEAIANLETLGMSGHSFGALTTQVMAGQMFPDEEGKLRVYRDDRFKAGILYSPVPIQHLALDDPRDIYGSISLPLLHMTGTDDASPVEGWDYKKRLVIHEHADHPEQYLHVLEDGDHMIYNGSRGKLGDNPNRDAHELEIKQTALAFWDAYLKDDDRAKEWLANMNA
ncbi:MAG: hypothetical protein AAF569_04255 [Pseudomonadota bacterium]